MGQEGRFRPLTARYALIYVVLSIVIAWSFEMVPVGWLERLTAEASSYALKTLGFSSLWGVRERGVHLSLVGGARDVSVYIIRECTGVHVLAIFTGLVLPVAGGLWLRKVWSLGAAASLLFVLNLSRVMLTVLLTAFDVPPFSWIFKNPTVETYHYPFSFLYGLFGVAMLVVIIGRWMLPELWHTLYGIFIVTKQYVTRASEKPSSPRR